MEVARQKLHMDLCPHVSFCFAAGYRHHRGCTELICCSLPSCAEENTEHILSEDGPSLKVLGMSGNLMVCCCSLAAVLCHLLFAGRDRLPTAACLSCSGLTTACPNGSSRKYIKKNIKKMTREEEGSKQVIYAVVMRMRLLVLFS